MRTAAESNLKKSFLSWCISLLRRIRTEHFSSETVREARTKINSNQERFNSSNEFMHIMWTAFFLGAICQDNKFVRLKQFQKLVLRASSRFQTLETTTSTRPFHLSGNLRWNTTDEGFFKHYLSEFENAQTHITLLAFLWANFAPVQFPLLNIDSIALLTCSFTWLAQINEVLNFQFMLANSCRSPSLSIRSGTSITRTSWWPGKRVVLIVSNSRVNLELIMKFIL